jgi:uncharacterized protein YkwD
VACDPCFLFVILGLTNAGRNESKSGLDAVRAHETPDPISRPVRGINEKAAPMIKLLSLVYLMVSNWFTLHPAPAPYPTPAPEPEPAPPIKPVPVPPSPQSSVVAAINSARASQGLSALVEDNALTRLAESWSASMAASIDLQHGDFTGRINSIYPDTAASENVAEGQPDANSVVSAWMNDPPHRANILGNYTRLGVGAERDASGTIYWCVDFVRID